MAIATSSHFLQILHMSSVVFISLFLKLALAFEEWLINSFSIHNKNFLNFYILYFSQSWRCLTYLYTIRIKEKVVKFEI